MSKIESNDDSPLLFSGSSHPTLANEIASLLKIPLGKIDLHLFPDEEIFVEIQEDVLEKNVFVLQSLFPNPNFHMMELLLIIDALKRAGAASITAIIPYYGYARQDRMDKPGKAISAKLVADLLTTAGIHHLITLDLHSDQIEGFFNIPVTHLLSRQLLIDYLKQMKLNQCIIVAPDKGGMKIASVYAKQLGCQMALIDKERIDSLNVKMHLFVGDVKGKTVLIPDDMCSAGRTLVNAAKSCAEFGANRIIAAVGHGLYVNNALELIENSPLEMIISTNSVALTPDGSHHPKIHTVSVAPLFAEAIKKIKIK